MAQTTWPFCLGNWLCQYGNQLDLIMGLNFIFLGFSSFLTVGIAHGHVICLVVGYFFCHLLSFLWHCLFFNVNHIILCIPNSLIGELFVHCSTYGLPFYLWFWINISCFQINNSFFLIMRKSYLHILIVSQGITVLFYLFLFQSFRTCLWCVYFSGCCYEIYVKAVMREEARKQAKAEGGSA